VVKRQQDDTRKAENVGLTNREPEKTFQAMMVAIRDSLSNLGSFNDWDDGEEDDEETEQGQLSEDDEHGWVMGTITKTVHQRLERFRQKQMTLDELTQPGWEDAADYFPERDKKYGTSTLRVPAVVQHQTDVNAPTPVPTTIGELLECLDILPGISQLPQGTSRPGSSHIKLGSGKPQVNTGIWDLAPTAKPDSLVNQNPKPSELVSVYPGI
jgi:hypothetical protein